MAEATSARPLLELREIDVFYGSAQALSSESIVVNRGEIVSLLGGNASGKSTTMKAILGLVKPTKGSVWFDGREITKLNTSQRVKLGIAAVPEARRVFPEMTVEENLLTGAFTRSRGSDIKGSLQEMYELFPRLAERRRQRAGTFSGGEQQMLAFARALMSRPSLICMDEPTMGLSPIYVEHVLDTIAQINRELGVATIIVEQNAELALTVAHRGYVLRTGEIVVSGAADELLSNPLVREAYLGKSAEGVSASDAARVTYQKVS